MKKQKAAFFDRDGTIIHDVGFLSDISKITYIDHMIEFMRACQAHEFLLFIITNQSGVARGYFDEAFVQKTHAFIKETLHNKGITITSFYYCPHHPTAAIDKRYLQTCRCRKPLPGMLEQAAQDFNVNLSSSLMIGDAPRDLQAGEAAGCISFDVTKILTLPHNKFSSLLKNIE